MNLTRIVIQEKSFLITWFLVCFLGIVIIATNELLLNYENIFFERGLLLATILIYLIGYHRPKSNLYGRQVIKDLIVATTFAILTAKHKRVYYPSSEPVHWTEILKVDLTYHGLLMTGIALTFVKYLIYKRWKEKEKNTISNKK